MTPYIKGKTMKQYFLKIIMVFCIILVLIIGLKQLIAFTPSGSVIKVYMELKYKRDFEIIEEFTHKEYADGELPQKELQCPAVVLQDKEMEDVYFLAYAYPFGSEDWIYRDNYCAKILFYFAKQEELEITNPETQADRKTSVSVKLRLDNSEETARKLQNVVNNFCDINKSDECGNFEVEGSLYVFQIEPKPVKDRWLEETSPFCYDTPLEKYKAFLDRLKRENEHE